MPGAQNKIFFLGAVMVLAVFCNNAHAQTTPSSELIAGSKGHDGKKVIYQGEVIGDKMARGEFAWINVNDGQSAIGVWAPQGLTREILVTGDYKHKGDIILVSGIFNRSCPEHGGDLDIHAQEISRIADGVKVKEKVSAAKAGLVLVLAVISGLIWILIRLKRR